MKVLRLLSLLPQRPKEFYDRASTVAVVGWEALRRKHVPYAPVTLDDAIVVLETTLTRGLAENFHEVALTEIEARVQKQNLNLPADAPFGTFHNGDTQLARFCYATARSLRPKVIVETGVCYGVTSAHLLQALAVNEEGCLHSIDLPPLGKNADDYVGHFVPKELRCRWTLHRGSSRRLLRPLLASLGEIDLFVHDSLHTYGNMREEFAAVWPVLRPGGALVSDDVHGNTAFLELMQSKDPALAVVIQTRNQKSLLGIAIKRQ